MNTAAKTEKATTGMGKAFKKNGRAKISIAINDEKREVAHFLETIKKFYSKRKVTAAEAYRMVVMRGISCVFEEIALAKATEAELENDRNQGRLFDN